MDNLAADFEINPNNPLNAEYELDEGVGFDCSFELYAAGTVWGSIDGNINNQTDLINLLNTKVDLTSFEELSTTVTNNYNELSDDISDLTGTVTDNYNTLSGQISDLTGVVNDNYTSLDNRLTTAEGSILNLTDTVNDNYTELNGKITTTNNNLSTLNQTVEDNNTAINNRVDGIVESFDGDISDLNNAIDNLSNTVSDNYTELNGKITVNTDNITTIQNTINSYGDIVSYDAAYFATANQGALADTALQPNDNISELVNNVGYITSASLPTVNNATITIQKNGADVGTFTLNQANNDTLNITVPTQASDIGAMPDTTTIEDLTTTAQLNALNSGATATNIGQITTNQNNIADIRDLIPLQASTSNQLADKGFVNSSIATNTAYFIGTFNSVAELEAYSGTLTNNDYAFVATTDSAGNTLYDRYKYNADTQQWIFEYELNNSSFTAQQWASINSGITSGDVTLIGTALQPNDNISELINDAGYITSASLPTNYVTTDTAQNISGRKTFLGEKAIYFKQNATTDKLGFTLYNPSNAELGALEWRPNTINGNALLALNCPQTGSNYVGFRYWSGINVVAPRPTTNGNYFIPVNFTDGTNTVTANNNGTLNISSLLPDVSDMATQTWVTNQGYTTNVGTVTSVNNIQPDASGNVTLTIPDTATWGNITGTLSNQTDLQNALNSKYDASNPNGYITSSDLPTNYVTTDTAQSISGQKTFTSTIKSSVNNSLALTQSTGEAFGVTVKRTDANNEIKFGIGSGGDNRGIWDVRHNKWAFNVTNDGKSYTLGNEIAIKSDLNSLSPLRYSRYSIAQVNSTNKFIKLASMTFTQSGNRDFSYLFWVEILEASTAKCYALVRLSARWSNTSYQGHKFEILEKYGDSAASLEAFKTLTYAYSLDTKTHKITAEIWLEIKNAGWVSYYLRPTECNEYGDYSNTPVTLSDNIWTYYNQSGDASRIASTAITSGLTQVKVSDATGVRNENNLSQVIKMWSGTKAQYDAIATKDANTLYNVEDTTSPIISILDSLYPVGSIYIGTMSACPLQTLGVGTWQLVATDRVLQGAGTRGSVGDTLNERLPNITGNFGANFTQGNFFNRGSGAFGSYRDNSVNTTVPDDSRHQYPNNNMWDFNASRSSSTYQDNAPVQQDAYLVNIWERVS